MKKNTLIIVAILVVIVLFAGLIIPLVTKEKAGDHTSSESNATSVADTNTSEQEQTEQLAVKETSAAETKDQKEKESESAKEGSSSEAGGSSEGSSGGSGNPGGSGGSTGESETETKESQPESGSQASEGSSGEGASSIPTISFPYAIPGTDLVVEQIRSYDGIFIEDASDSETSGIAALVLTNNGDNLEFAGIGISQGTRSLGFSASQIPAGATVIIQEQNKASFSSDPYYSATATTTPVEEFEMSEELVSVKDNGDNSLDVTNLTDKTLSEVKLSFKNYLPEEDVYVGGITYNITLKDLEPNTAMTVSANHYDSKYSKVLEVHAE